jgi:hypothetical protein
VLHPKATGVSAGNMNITANSGGVTNAPVR